MFVCFLGGFFILFLFSCSTVKQCLQNGVNGETALRWVFSTSVSPSAEGTRTYSMQRQTLAECLWKHRHDEAVFGPSRCSQIRPRSTKQIPSSFPTIQEDMDGFQKYGSKYIFEVKEIFWITSKRDELILAKSYCQPWDRLDNPERGKTSCLEMLPL